VEEVSVWAAETAACIRRSMILCSAARAKEEGITRRHRLDRDMTRRVLEMDLTGVVVGDHRIRSVGMGAEISSRMHRRTE
jgi:hypothetical protein